MLLQNKSWFLNPNNFRPSRVLQCLYSVPEMMGQRHHYYSIIVIIIIVITVQHLPGRNLSLMNTQHVQNHIRAMTSVKLY